MKVPVYTHKLLKAVEVGPALSPAGQRAFQLTFGQAYGLADMEGRQVTVTMTGHELAQAIGSIKARHLEAPEDMKAIRRVQDLLRRTNRES